MRCAACISHPGSFNPDQENDTPLPELDEEGQKGHSQFMTYVFDLIDGTRDSSQYEDDVRALLGELHPSLLSNFGRGKSCEVLQESW